MRFVAVTVVLVSTLASGPLALANEKCTAEPAVSAPATWGTGTSSPIQDDASRSVATVEDSPSRYVAHARDLLARARLLDEVATSDEKAVADITARIPTLRASAKSARERAERAKGEAREALVSRAEDLEADLAVSEAEVVAKKRSSADNRRIARELRARAVRVVRDAPTDPTTDASCDPPYRFTADGRKAYRVECLR